MIDVENAVIVDVEATPARTYDEVKCTEAMETARPAFEPAKMPTNWAIL